MQHFILCVRESHMGGIGAELAKHHTTHTAATCSCSEQAQARADARRQAAAPSAHPIQPAPYPGIIAEARHPGKADAAHRRVSGLADTERVTSHSRSTRNTHRNLAALRGEAAERQR